MPLGGRAAASRRTMGRTDAVKEDHAPSADEGVLNDPPASLLAGSATRGTMHAPSPRTLFPSLAQASAWDCATSQATTRKARSGSRAPMGAEGFARTTRVIARAVAAQPPCGALRLPEASRDPRKSVHKPSSVRRAFLPDAGVAQGSSRVEGVAVGARRIYGQPAQRRVR